MITNQKPKFSKKSYYPVRLRKKIIQSIDAGLFTPSQACEKYGLSTKLLRQWYRWYFKSFLQPHTNWLMKRKKDPEQQHSPEKEIASLKAQLKATQKALEEEKLKSRAYEIMIDIAEKELNVPVRKKSGTQQ